MSETTEADDNALSGASSTRGEAAEADRPSGGNERRDDNDSLSLAMKSTANSLATEPPLIRFVEVKRERLEQMLGEARQKTTTKPWIPKLFRGLFRRQG